MFEHWNGLFLVVALGVVVIVISEISSYLRERSLIRNGVLKAVDKTTEKDIARLKKEGYSIWAIKRYRQINKGTSLRQAKEYVDSLD